MNRANIVYILSIFIIFFISVVYLVIPVYIKILLTNVRKSINLFKLFSKSYKYKSYFLKCFNRLDKRFAGNL